MTYNKGVLRRNRNYSQGETHDPPQVEDIPTYGEKEGQHEVDLNSQRLNNC